MTEGGSLTTRKVAIVGTSDTTRHMAPVDDPSWEIWTLNDMGPLLSRIDRLFELHSAAILERDAKDLEHEFAWFKANDSVPVYMAEPLDWIPCTVEFPTQALVKEFGDYFTNSVSWMMALAIYEGVEAIGLWGVDMAHGTEYAAQRPSCEYFIGLARGRGIDVYIPPQSDLLKCAELYGLETSALPQNLQTRIAGLKDQLARCQNEKLQAIVNEARTQAAIEVMEYVKAAWTNPSTIREP